MKNWKTLVVGFVAGATVMSATPVLGAAYKTVSAYLMHDAMFTIDDKIVASPSNQPVLNYNNYTYVPTRFVAEALGCDVKWDVVTRKVIIKAPEPKVVEKEVVKEVEKIVYVDKNSNPDTKVYSKLPVKESKDGYKITVTTLVMDDEDVSGMKKTRVYLNLENTRLDKMELVQDDAKLILDDKEYSMTIRENEWDSKWSQEYIKKDEDLDGYLIFDGVKNDYSTGSLQFEVRKVNDNNSESETVTINFKK